MKAAFEEPVRRRRELAAIHAMAKELALAEDSYRPLVARFSKKGVESAGQLTAPERTALIEHLKSLGAGKFRKQGRKSSKDGQVRKVFALWKSLGDYGVLKDPSSAGLRAFVRRMTDVEDPEWLDARQLNTVIEALKDWLKRETGAGK